MQEMELVEIHHHIAIFTDGDYYYCDGLYAEFKTKEDALRYARSRGRIFLVNDENMKKLIQLGFVRDEFAYGENGVERESWRRYLQSGSLTFKNDGTFSIQMDGNINLLKELQIVIEDITKLRV